MSRDFKQRSADSHSFAMIPRSDIPRSSFRMSKTLKTTFDSGYLVPIFCEEVLPGDTFNVNMTSFVRLATPIFPFMDNLHLETFFFFVPNRLVWDNWQKFMGEQANPGDSISFVIPTVSYGAAGSTNAVGTLPDYFGIPIADQIAPSQSITVNSLPLRAYNLIWNEWFRSQDLQNSVPVPTNDGPDNNTDFVLLRRGKRHDYFTSCLPWPNKGGVQISVPLGGNAPVKVNAAASLNPLGILDNTNTLRSMATDTATLHLNAGSGTDAMFADLSQATGATINAMRQSFQIQKLLERDARGGTRYTEIVRSHFGVVSPDARLQRPEYLGGGSSPINVNAVAQTSATGTYADSPIGTLSATAQSVGKHGFSQSFTEHGYIIGLANVRADLTYQQGMRRHWSRRTRYDFYFPAFAHLGEQAVLNKEIYCNGGPDDANVFGYQERWAEYRYNPSEITGLMRSTAPGTIDPWHLSQRFTSLPTLGSTFIQENPPLDRVLAVGAAANGQQLLADLFYSIKAARPMPMYSVPGLIDHF